MPTVVQLATLPLVNTSGSTQATGSVTPMFGWVFKRGDIPSGTAPQFLVSGVAQPYSWGCQSTWADGSLKFASFVLRTTASVAGSGTLSVGVWNNGAAPATSARTLTEVYNQSLQVNATGANFGLSGTYVAALVNDANNVEQLVYLDGAAGKVWRVKTHFATGGTAHGQLECYHYVAALTDASGNLGGIRHLGRICQPHYNFDTPAKNWRAFSSVSWQYGVGPTTVPLVWPFSNADFTWTSGAIFHTTAANNFYSGAIDTNIVPCYLTTTGTLPAGLLTTRIYFVKATSGSQTVNFQTQSAYTQTANVSATDAGTGTHTIHPVPTCLHFGTVYTADINARWNFFQGTGSMAADTTLRTQIDQNYWQSSRVIPPYDLSLSANDNPTFAYDWNPVSIANFYSFGEASGERGEIGIIPSACATHFHTQTAASEVLIRKMGLAGVHSAYCFRDHTTGTIVHLGDPAVTYTGMPASVATTVAWGWGTGSTANVGFTQPPGDNQTLGFSQNSPNHKPAYSVWTYLFTGEPQYLDMLIEEANGGLLFGTPDNFHRNQSTPAQVYGITTGFSETRALAWETRDVAWVAGLYPDTSPDGTAIKTYFRDRLSSSAKHANGLVDATLTNAYIATTLKWWFPFLNWGGNQTSNADKSWESQYMMLAALVASVVAEDPDWPTWLNNRINFLEHVRSIFGGYCLTGYVHRNVTIATDVGLNGWPPDTSDTDWATNCPYTSIAWTSGANAVFTFVFPTGAGLTLADGWKLFFATIGGAPTGLSVETAYYTVQTSGGTAKLSLTPGGAPVTTTGSSGATQAFIITFVPSNPPAATANAQASPSGGGSDGYIADMHGGVAWAIAAGYSGLTAVESHLAQQLTATGVSFADDPKDAMQTSYHA